MAWPSEICAGKYLTVEAVVDAVDLVFRSRIPDDEPGLVRLDDVLRRGSEPREVVNFGDVLVRAVGDDFAGDDRVHPLDTQVGADVGVVQVDDGSAAEVFDVFVINLGVGGRGDGRGGADSGGRAQEGATVAFGADGGFDRGLRVRGERSGRTAREDDKIAENNGHGSAQGL